MPRPKKAEHDGKEVKKRSRNGCWPCKARKVKCGEEKPTCINCQRQGETCDYSIRLNWEGRSKKKDDGRPGSSIMSFQSMPVQGSDPLPHTQHTESSSGVNLVAGQRQILSLPRTIASAQPTSQEDTLPPISNFTTMPINVEGLSAEVHPALRDMSTSAWLDRSVDNPQVNHPSGSLSRFQYPLPAYPSPSEVNFANNVSLPMPLNGNGLAFNMPPPLPTPNTSQFQESIRSPYNGAKRLRLSPRSESFARNSGFIPRKGSYGSGEYEDPPRVQFHNPVYFPPHLSNPFTPAASSASLMSQDASDRRISVSSLLSDDADFDDRRPSYTSEPARPSVAPISRRGSLHQRMVSYSETDTYGHDRGLPDLDVPRNNDTTAISGMSPSEHSEFDAWLHEADLGIPEFGFGLSSRETVFAKGGYYANPVPVKIPRKLEPLPSSLSENPMNLLYFHHFLNHTARILVPHDCPENPFKTILPKMAMDNPNVLHLLLAYSACHRARLLNHPEPKNRIAQWVRDVFPSLRHSLDNADSTEIPNATLATAILLASLEIVSPSSFGVSIPWQSHLNVARSIIKSRGGPNSVSRKDPVMYFLTRWLAYLDVLGSLCGRKNEEPLFEGNYWSSSHDEAASSHAMSTIGDEDFDEEDDYTIDCLLGFTTRCVSILAKIASLAKKCENERINSETGQVNLDWRPPEDVVKRAQKLRKDLEDAREHRAKQCIHHSPQLHRPSLVAQDLEFGYAAMSTQQAEEAGATNSAFHWAGLVHILRRIYNLPRTDPQVQHAVHEIIKVVTKIRESGSAEACLLFPMFTAGVEAVDELDRATIGMRIRGAEGLGMCQVSRARRIMEEVWKTGVSWEGLAAGDFFG